MLLIKRVCAYVIDYLIISVLTIFICSLLFIFAIKERTISDVFLISFSLFFVNYKLTLFWIIYELISTFILSLFVINNNGLTIGDSVMKIKVNSSKFDGLKFYFLRFLLREITVFFKQIFIFVIIINMVLKRSINSIWYDDILGINIIDIKRNFTKNREKN